MKKVTRSLQELSNVLLQDVDFEINMKTNLGNNPEKADLSFVSRISPSYTESRDEMSQDVAKRLKKDRKQLPVSTSSFFLLIHRKNDDKDLNHWLLYSYPLMALYNPSKSEYRLLPEDTTFSYDQRNLYITILNVETQYTVKGDRDLISQAFTMPVNKSLLSFMLCMKAASAYPPLVWETSEFYTLTIFVPQFLASFSILKYSFFNTTFLDTWLRVSDCMLPDVLLLVFRHEFLYVQNVSNIFMKKSFVMLISKMLISEDAVLSRFLSDLSKSEDLYVDFFIGFDLIKLSPKTRLILYSVYKTAFDRYKSEKDALFATKLLFYKSCIEKLSQNPQKERFDELRLRFTINRNMNELDNCYIDKLFIRYCIYPEDYVKTQLNHTVFQLVNIITDYFNTHIDMIADAILRFDQEINQ